jgi:hypothetical protein
MGKGIQGAKKVQCRGSLNAQGGDAKSQLMMWEFGRMT